jgi:predicted dithiol-disulfide oxidoreductase (DUF899 family)
MLAAYQQRMGWSFSWVSSASTDFNFDYNVSVTPDLLETGKATYNYARLAPSQEDREEQGISVFTKDDAGRIFHTYSTYWRGIDMVSVAYHIIDLTPTGRDEAGHDNPTFWLRRHDEYAD